MKQSSRYVAGKSGNKKGRPRGAGNRKKVLEEALLERHRVIQDGAPLLRSTYELLLITVRNLAMQGDLRAISAHHQLLEACDLEDPAAASHGSVIVPEMDHSFWTELLRQQQAWLQDHVQRFETGAADPNEEFVPNWTLFKELDD